MKLNKKEIVKIMGMITGGLVCDIEIGFFGYMTYVEIHKGFGINQEMIDKIKNTFLNLGYRVIELDTLGYPPCWRFNLNISPK